MLQMLEPLPAAYEMLLQTFAWMYGSMAGLLLVAGVVLTLVECWAAYRDSAHSR
jgi:hypothetical protein